MKRKVPVLGILYNVVSLGALVVLIVAMFMHSLTLFMVAVFMLIPTIALPGTPGFTAYWKKFEE